MRFIKPALLVMIIVLHVNSLSAQEKLSADDIFKWLPFDLYESIYHEESAAMKKAPSYSIFTQLGTARGTFDLRMVPIPTLFENTWESVTIAQKIKLLVSKHKKNQTRMSQFILNTASLEIGDTVYTAKNSGHWLAVYRFVDLDSLISTAEKAGEISSTDIKILNRNLFSSSGRVRLNNVAFYLYPTESQELLVCSDLNFIRKMIATGHGEHENFLEEKNFEPVADMMSDLGQAWFWKPISIPYQLILDTAENDGVDSHIIDRKRTEIEQDMQWELLSCAFGDDLTTIGMLYFGDENQAEEHVKRNRMRLDPDRKGISTREAIRRKAIDINLTGTLSSITTFYTQELMDALIKAEEEYETEMKRKKAESKQKKNKQDQ